MPPSRLCSGNNLIQHPELQADEVAPNNDQVVYIPAPLVILCLQHFEKLMMSEASFRPNPPRLHPLHFVKSWVHRCGWWTAGERSRNLKGGTMAEVCSPHLRWDAHKRELGVPQSNRWTGRICWLGWYQQPPCPAWKVMSSSSCIIFTTRARQKMLYVS